MNNALVALRKKQALNQKEMALAIGVSASYYYKIESGYQNPSFEFLSKLKTSFPETIIDDLFFSKEKPMVDIG